MPNFFWHTLQCQESQIWAFLRASEVLHRGPQKQERKNHHNSIISLTKNKVRSNFIWEKLMEFLSFNEVLKNLIFFQLPIKKVGFIMLILSKFQICGQLIVKYLNLWFTLLFVHFGKFCGPEKRPNFRIDLWVYIKKLDFGSTFLKVLSCIFLHVAPISSFNEININNFWICVSYRGR